MKKTSTANYPTIFVDSSCGKEFVTISTKKSEESRVVDGVTTAYNILKFLQALIHFIPVNKSSWTRPDARKNSKERTAKTAVAAVRKGKKAKRE